MIELWKYRLLVKNHIESVWNFSRKIYFLSDRRIFITGVQVTEI